MKRLYLGHFLVSANAIYTEKFKKIMESGKWPHPKVESTLIPAINDLGEVALKVP
jgi:hypothetical protein